MKLPNIEIIISYKIILGAILFVIVGISVPIIWIYGLGKWWGK